MKEKKADGGVEQMDRNEVTDVRRPEGTNTNIRFLFLCGACKDGCQYLFEFAANSAFCSQRMKALAMFNARSFLQTQPVRGAAVWVSIQNTLVSTSDPIM